MDGGPRARRAARVQCAQLETFSALALCSTSSEGTQTDPCRPSAAPVLVLVGHCAPVQHVVPAESKSSTPAEQQQTQEWRVRIWGTETGTFLEANLADFPPLNGVKGDALLSWSSQSFNPNPDPFNPNLNLNPDPDPSISSEAHRVRVVDHERFLAGCCVE